MNNLSERKCAPCEGGVDPLTAAESEPYHQMVPEWNRLEDKKIERDFEFKGFANALEFVNAVGAVAESEGHHPDILVHDYKYVRITLWTHAIGGLSINDFIVASKVDRLRK